MIDHRPSHVRLAVHRWVVVLNLVIETKRGDENQTLLQHISCLSTEPQEGIN